MQTQTIVKLGRLYADHHGKTLSTVSTYAANDGKWLPGLERGASCTLRKAASAVQWFSDHWPEDLEWPRDIQRPVQKKGAA